MDREYQNAVKIIAFAVGVQKEQNLDKFSEIEESDWEKIWEILKVNHMIGITYQVIQQNLDWKISEKMRQSWKQTALYYGILQSKKRHDICNLLKLSEENNITMVLFKGEVLAQLYPEPLMRVSCDCDIFVDEKEKEKAVFLMEKLGFTYIEQGSKKNVPVYKNQNGTKIELHTRLWEDYEGEITQILDSFHLTDKKTLIPVKLEGQTIFTLGYEEHLIFQMFHIIKHFSLEGVGIRYMVDITLYINQYIDFIDKKRFWKRMKQLRYAVFCDLFFKMAVKFFAMDNRILQDANTTMEIDEDLFEDFMNHGKLENKERSWQAFYELTPYYMRERTKKDSSLKILYKMFFPEKEKLKEEYSYMKHGPFLVPFAWTHRLWRIAKFKVKKKEMNQEVFAKLRKVEQRLSMMERAGLLEKSENGGTGKKNENRHDWT